MHQFLARYSAPVSLVHAPSWVDFITTMVGFKVFGTHRISLRKRTEQMLGEFYCFLNVPLAELFDLKDRLRHFVSSAGPKEIRTNPVKASE